jgi:acetolactate synthase small subunit
LAKPFGIIDIARTGVTALQRSGAWKLEYLIQL